MSALRLEPVTKADLDAVHALNEAALPAVGKVPPSAFERFRAIAEAFLVARRDGTLCGFCILLAPGTDYASPNYRWFAARYPDFLYVDRIVVAEEARGTGIGRAFYEDAWRRCLARGAPLTCEVNLRPPNPESMAFHARMGFRGVGTQDTEGGAKSVCMLVREE